MRRLRLVFFGSGTFGLPSLAALLERHDVELVVTQPDRSAGRGRQLASTPVGIEAGRRGLECFKPEEVNAPDAIARIHAVRGEAFVVIAFGQKLGRELLGDTFAINLHGSLLPRHRGAAPVNWALLAGDERSGVSVITLAQRMDAGEILAESVTAIDPNETAGELHDRLAQLGPAALLDALDRHANGATLRRAQDDRAATRAPKFARGDGWVRFDVPAEEVRRRVHGLTPWPGVSVRFGEHEARLLRVGVRGGGDAERGLVAGTLSADGAISCAVGAVIPLEVQPSGGKAMSFADFRRGRTLAADLRVESVVTLPERVS